MAKDFVKVTLDELADMYIELEEEEVSDKVYRGINWAFEELFGKEFCEEARQIASES